MSAEILAQGLLLTGMPLILWLSAGGTAGTRNPKVWAPFLIAAIGLILMMHADHDRGPNFPNHLFLDPSAPGTLEMFIGMMLCGGGFLTSVIVAVRVRDTIRGIIDRRSDWLLGELDGAGYTAEELQLAEQDLLALQVRVRWVGHADEWISHEVVESALARVRSTSVRELHMGESSEVTRN